uniref:Uncharacterized protein n=1 Tax=Hyaloperonospora arabidopsidis (strain Emoy2) TaxID=559515 RepID=M4BTU4_HYAAE
MPQQEVLLLTTTSTFDARHHDRTLRSFMDTRLLAWRGRTGPVHLLPSVCIVRNARHCHLDSVARAIDKSVTVQLKHLFVGRSSHYSPTVHELLARFA